MYRADKIISSLHIFAPTKIEAEITALTLPSERKKGYFKKILEHSKNELLKRGLKSIVYVCDKNSTAGTETIKHIGAEYEFSEFLMRYDKEKIRNFIKNGKVEIAKAEINDIKKYIAINNKAFKTNKTETAEVINDFFTSEKREIFGIKYATELIGMIGIYEEEYRYYIHGFCIDPDYQKRGIGHIALNEIVNKCLERDKNRIIELEVQTKNEKALKVYQNIGFEVTTEFRYYRNEVE